MSGYLGKMREYRQLSIDRFDGLNLKSTAFFLSHCHKDHMTGLDSSAFIDQLRSRTDVFLYCTEISKVLLLSESIYRPLQKYIKVLTPEMAESISLPDVDSCKCTEILVTPLPALHCPGSVMFMFEGDEGTVLYTGDFRWETNHAINISAFKSGESLKEIESMYIDTTFCVESAFRFPTRMECCEVSCNIVNDWLSRSNQHYVHITSRTKYGHEPLMRAIYDSTGYKIHVPEWKFAVYSQISELSDVFTTSRNTRVHACNRVHDKAPGSKLPCGFALNDGQQLKVRSIRPSTMFFTMGHQNIDSDRLYVAGRSLHRVCYSFHSSYSEIRDIVMYLKPKRIVPNVKPLPDKEIRQVQQRLNKFLQLPHRLHLLASPSTNLGKLKQRIPLKSLNKQELTDSEELVFDSQSPMKVKNTGSSESHILKTPDKSQDYDAVDMTSPTKTDSSQVSSSYEPSILGGDEMSLIESDDQHEDLDGEDEETQQSLCLYVSGDDEVSEDERVSSLQFKKSVQEESLRTEESVGNELTSETMPEVDRFENKVNGMMSEKRKIGYHDDISDIDEEGIGKTDKNSATASLNIDKNDDNDANSATDLTVINKNNDEDLSARDSQSHDGDQNRTDFSPTNDQRHNNNNNENSATDSSSVDSKGDEHNQNRKDGKTDDDLSCVDESVEKHVQCKDVENTDDVASPGNDNPTKLHSSICDGLNEKDTKTQTDNTTVEASRSDASSEDNKTKTTDNLRSICKSQNRKKSLSERTNSFDLFEDNVKSNVEESQGFYLQCLTTDNQSGNNANSKSGDSQGFNDCSVGHGDGVNAKAGDSEGFNNWAAHDDDVQVEPHMLKVDSSIVLTRDDDHSSTDGVRQCETKNSESDDCSEASSKAGEHLEGLSDTQEHLESTSKTGEYSESPSKKGEHSESPSETGKHSETNLVSADVTVRNKGRAYENIHDNHFKKNDLNVQSKIVHEEENVDLLSVVVLDTSNEDSFSEKMVCSPQLPNTDHSRVKDKRQSSTEEPREDKSIKGDGHRPYKERENAHSSNSNGSNTDDQTSKLTPYLSRKQTSVSCMEQDDNDSDVVIIDLSDSDSQEPPSKRWKHSPLPKADGFIGHASTSRNRSVLDHLHHLKTVLDNGHDSDSDNTLPPSQNLLDACGFYSDSDSDGEVQIISDDEDDYSQNCYSHHLEDLNSTGWHTARVGVNESRAISNRNFDEEECIDLTLEDD